MLCCLAPPRATGIASLPRPHSQCGLQVAYDAALIDVLSGQIGFAASKASLWPPAPSEGQPGFESSDRTKVLVVPTQGLGHAIDPTELVVVAGKFRSLLDFWAAPDVMRRGFVEGYQMAASLMDLSEPVPPAIASAQRKLEGGGYLPEEGDNPIPELSGLPVAEWNALVARVAAEALLGEVMKEQSSWKTTAAFVKPPLWFESDPLFALFILVAIVVFAFSYLVQRSYLAADIAALAAENAAAATMGSP